MKSFPGRSGMQSSWTKGQASESIVSMLISLFICQDGKLPVIKLSMAHVPTFKSRKLYVEGPVPLPMVGEGSSQGNQPSSFQEKQALNWNDQQMFTA